MTQTYDSTRRSISERIGHAVTFELLATIICAPVIAWIMGKSLADTGTLTLMFAIIAMLWNMVFNSLFDHAQRSLEFRRTPRVRVLHALLFEAGLIVILVPLAAWWLRVSLIEAFLLDIGMILFFLPYAMAFNWVYDLLRERRVRARMERTMP